MLETKFIYLKTRRKLPHAAAIALTIFALSACSKAELDEDVLPALGASNVVTVSGISSGGYMAVQYQVAYSAQVSGAGVVAAGPWGCANNDIGRALGVCMSGDGVDLEMLHQLAGEKVAAGTIDDTENLDDARLFFFRGSIDAVVGSAVVSALQHWFMRYTNDENTRMVTDIPVAHGWPTIDAGNECDVFAKPYINSCDYDLAGELLSQLYPNLKPPADATHTPQRFDQRPFDGESFADFGYVYIPEACKTSAGCDVHVFFHGCDQSSESVGTALVENAGFNRWAESNKLIVVYPQVKSSSLSPMNPLGCWDWWGYTGADYLDKSGSQLAAIRRIAGRLAGGT